EETKGGSPHPDPLPPGEGAEPTRPVAAKHPLSPAVGGEGRGRGSALTGVLRLQRKKAPHPDPLPAGEGADFTSQSRKSPTRPPSGSRRAPASTAASSSRERDPPGTRTTRQPAARANSASTSMSPTARVSAGETPACLIKPRSIAGSGLTGASRSGPATAKKK